MPSLASQSDLQKAFEEYLNNRLKDYVDPANLYDTFHYAFKDGGKMLRPLSVLISGSAFGIHLDKILPAALGVELFHNFTLLHDDIMDQSDLRRGKATVVNKFGLNSAILSGDAMAIKAYGEILLAVKKCHADTLVIEDFNKMAISVCEGQQMDMDFEVSSEIFLEHYIEMIGKKTASLFAFCLQCGASLAKEDRRIAMKLYRIGMNAGVAFQIQDDYLDFYGDMDKVGKAKGGDIIQGKKTALILSALDQADDRDRLYLMNLLNGIERVESKVEAVTPLFEKYHVEEKVRLLKEEYWANALGEIEVLMSDYPKLSVLKEFLLQLIIRQK